MRIHTIEENYGTNIQKNLHKQYLKICKNFLVMNYLKM